MFVLQFLKKVTNFRIKKGNAFYVFVYYWYVFVSRINRIRKGDFLGRRVQNPKARLQIGNFSFACLFITIALLFLITGCENSNPYNKGKKARYTKNSSLNRTQIERLLAERGFNPLSRIRSIAVAPCYNLTDSKHLNTLQFSEAIASNLSELERFHVIFPREIINRGMRLPIPTEDNIKKKGIGEPVAVELPKKGRNKANKNDKDTPRMIMDADEPIKLKWLSAIAQSLDVDAILIVYVKEYDPYHPPKITITTKLVLINTGLFTVSEHKQLRFEDLSEYGMHPNIVGAREKVEKEMLWRKTTVYDAGFVKTKRAIKSYAKKNDSKERPFGPEYVTRILKNYYAFIGFDLTKTIAMTTDPEVFEKKYKEYEKELKRTVAADERDKRREERAMRRGSGSF